MNDSRIAFVGEVHQQLLFHSGVGQRADLGKLILCVCIGQIQLGLNQLDRLLRKKLGRQVLAHLVPVALFLQLVDGRQLLGAVLCNIMTLATSLDKRPERVVRIVLDFFQYVQLRSTRSLIGVKYNVYTIRHVFGVHGHTLEIMGPVNHDPDLSIVGSAQIQVRNASSELNDTIFSQAAFLGISNFYPVRADAGRIFSLIPSFAAIGTVIFSDRLDQGKVLINLTLIDVWHGYNWGDSSIFRIVDLRNTNAKAVVTLSLQNEKRLLKDTTGNTKLTLSSAANIKGTFFRKLLLQPFRSLPRFIFVGCSVLIEKGSNR